METEYLKLLRDILDNGEFKPDRTGVGTQSVFGRQIRTDLSTGRFPLLTTKKVYWKGVVEELLWFLRGETNIKSLQEKGVNIWNEWADENGDLGPVYGHQWRRFDERMTTHGGLPARELEGIDQIARLMDDIKNNPMSRRLIVTGWNPREIDQVKLPPCHTLFQFMVTGGGTKLSCQLYQRSADVFLGVPFNIASYALLTRMVAFMSGLEPGEFIHTFGDVHVYNNARVQVLEQLSREPKNPPALAFKRTREEIGSIDQFRFEDFELIGYDPHPAIKAEVAV